MSIKVPPFLQKGDTIGIVAPAGFMPIEKMQSCIETLDAWGYTVEMGSTTHSQSENYFSGSDEERRHDLQQMLDNRNVKAILCARGGYGLSRIVDDLDFRKFKKHPKWLIGFSDVTVLHAQLFSKYKIASLHAPMAAAFNDGGSENVYIESIQKALEGEPANYECAHHVFNKTGEAKGELVGGNLALLVHLIGTPSDLNTKNKILFIEDVGEYIYNVDRMLVQLKRSGKLDKLAGLIIGGFTDMKDTDRPYGKTTLEVINDHVKDFEFPVCFNFPVSHDKENVALKIGVKHSLEVTENGARLQE